MKKKINSNRLFVKKKDLRNAIIATFVCPIIIFLGVSLFYTLNDLGSIETLSFVEIVGGIIISLIGGIIIFGSLICFFSFWSDVFK